MVRRFGPMVAVAMLAVFVLAACGTSDEDAPATVTRVSEAYTPGPPPVSDGGAAAGQTPTAGGGAAAGVVEVDMVDIAFEQTEITIPAGTDVTFQLVNKGASQHQFKIDALGIDSGLVDPGQTAELTVNAAAGEYAYNCPVPGHTEAGMVGTLKVVEGAPMPGGLASPAAGASPVAPAASPAPVEGQGDVAAPTTIEVDMVDIAFEPKEITIPANTDVTITLVNTGAAVHNFIIESLGINSGDYAPGQTGTVTINAAAGEYEYVCTQPGHREAGMVGKLVVT